MLSRAVIEVSGVATLEPRDPGSIGDETDPAGGVGANGSGAIASAAESESRSASRLCCSTCVSELDAGSGGAAPRTRALRSGACPDRPSPAAGLSGVLAPSPSLSLIALSANACSRSASSGSSGSIGTLTRPRDARRRSTGAESGAFEIVEAGISGAVNGIGTQESTTLPTMMSGSWSRFAAAILKAGARTALLTSDRVGRNGVAREGIAGPVSTGAPTARCSTGFGAGRCLTDAARRRGSGSGGSAFAAGASSSSSGSPSPRSR